LLHAATPSIRFFTLRDILERLSGSADVRHARDAIVKFGPAPAILRRQTPDGRWRGERSFYGPKYVSTHWSMMLLGELGLDRTSPGFRRGAAFMLAAAAEGLAPWQEAESPGVTCLWGNILRYTVQAGCGRDPRMRKLAERVASDIGRHDCRCVHNRNVPCAWGVARGLWGLAALPAEERSREVRRAAARGLAFLLEDHHLEAADYPRPKGSGIHPLWFGLNFPLFYQADILFTLRVLGEWNALRRPGAQPALDWLEECRAENGRWRGRSPYRSRTWKSLGGSEETSRWVTLFARKILRRAGRSVT
jgi:hypothetical protein